MEWKRATPIHPKWALFQAIPRKTNGPLAGLASSWRSASNGGFRWLGHKITPVGAFPGFGLKTGGESSAVG